MQRIGFIGTGRMATALARGFVDAKAVAGEAIVGFDVVTAATTAFVENVGARAVNTDGDVFAHSDVVILATKPHQLLEVLANVHDAVEPRHLVVSIAAGVPLKTLETALPSATRVVRVMPNTPCLIARGACAYALGSSATEADAELVEWLLNTVGWSTRVPERLLDAVTGLSGSGPAYVYQVVEALSDGGVRAGLPRDTATRLAAQTLIGAAAMVLETGEHPGALKDAVTSPGGTTIAGLHALECGGMRGLLIDAVQAATQRSRELGQSS